MRHRKIIRF